MPIAYSWNSIVIYNTLSYQYQINANNADGTILATGEISIKSQTIRFDLSVDNISDSEVNLSFSSYTEELDSIISLNYHLVEDEKNIGNPIFTGKIKLLWIPWKSSILSNYENIILDSKS